MHSRVPTVFPILASRPEDLVAVVSRPDPRVDDARMIGEMVASDDGTVRTVAIQHRVVAAVSLLAFRTPDSVAATSRAMAFPRALTTLAADLGPDRAEVEVAAQQPATRLQMPGSETADSEALVLAVSEIPVQTISEMQVRREK